MCRKSRTLPPLSQCSSGAPRVRANMTSSLSPSNPPSPYPLVQTLSPTLIPTPTMYCRCSRYHLLRFLQRPHPPMSWYRRPRIELEHTLTLLFGSPLKLPMKIIREIRRVRVRRGAKETTILPQFCRLWVSRPRWRSRLSPATCGQTPAPLVHPKSLLPLRPSQGGGSIARKWMTRSRWTMELKST